MLKSFIILLILFSNKALFSQSAGTFALSNYEIKNFLKDARESMHLPHLFNLEDKFHAGFPTNFVGKFLHKDSVYLTAQDIDFFNKQVNQRTGMHWNIDLVDKVVILKSTDIDKIFKNNPDKALDNYWKKYRGSLYRLSLPYFTEDKQTCIITIEKSSGLLFGSTELLVLKRKNGKWTLFKRRTLSVS